MLSLRRLSDLNKAVRANDADAYHLAADDSNQVICGQCCIIVFDCYIVACRCGKQCTFCEVSNDRERITGRSCSKGLNAVIKNNFQALKRIITIVTSSLHSFESAPCLLIHNNNRIGSYVGKLTNSAGNSSQCDGRRGNNRNRYASGAHVCGNGAACLNSCNDKSLDLLSNLVCDFVVDITQESVSAHVHNAWIFLAIWYVISS